MAKFQFLCVQFKNNNYYYIATYIGIISEHGLHLVNHF